MTGSELLYLEDINLQEETYEEIQDIADNLRQSIAPDAQFRDLTHRRDACERASKVAFNQPEVVRLLSPLLDDVLNEEVKRRYGWVAEKIFLDSVSQEVEAASARALVEVAGPDLIEAYESNEQSVDSLINTLVQTITEGNSQSARHDSIESLSRLSISSPMVVADKLSVAATSVVQAVNTLVATADTIGQYRACARLLALLVYHHSIRIPDSDGLRRSLMTLRGQDDPVCGAYVELILEVIKSTLKQRRSIKITESKTVTTLVDEIHAASERDQELTTQALGELITIVSETPDTVPEVFITDVRKATHWTRRREAAKMLGLVVAFGTENGELAPDGLVSHVREATNWEERRDAARALGMLVVSNSTRVQFVSEELVSHVRELSGVERQISALTLGLIGAFACYDTEPAPERLVSRVQEATDWKERVETACALGFVVTVGPASDAPVNKKLLADFQESTDWLERRIIAKALGWVAAYGSDNDQSSPKQLIASIREPIREPLDWRERRAPAAQALGWVVMYSPASDVSFPKEWDVNFQKTTDWDERKKSAEELGLLIAFGLNHPFGSDSTQPTYERLITFIQESSNLRESVIIAEALGFISAFGGVSDEPVSEKLASYVREETGIGRRIVARALGLIVTFRTVKDEASIKKLVASVREGTDWKDPYTALMLGLVVAFGSSNHLSAPKGLVTRVRESTEWEERIKAAEALGWAVIFVFDSGPSTRAELVTRAREAPDLWERKLAARALGWVVAFDSTSNADAPENLVTQVREATHWDASEETSRALEEFQAVTSVTDGVTPVTHGDAPEELYTQVWDSIGIEHEATVEALGWMVAVESDDHMPLLEDLVTHVQRTSGRERRAFIRALNEVIDTGDSVSAAIRLLTNLRQGIHWRWEEAYALEKIVTSTPMETDQMLTALTCGDEGGPTVKVDITPYLNLDEPARRRVLSVIDTVIAGESEIELSHLIRQQLQTFLKEQGDIPASTRLAAINVLVNIEETATDSNIRPPTDKEV